MIKSILSILLSLVILASTGCYFIYHFSADSPASGSEFKLKGLTSPVSVDIDHYGIPQIRANSQEDAFSALGFLVAKARLFQMDLIRRHMSGHLAEVMGAKFKETDRWHRVIGFKQLAQKIYQTLSPDQQRILNVYANGVNQAMNEMTILPPEFLVLGYRPAPWTAEDSLLVILGMETDLTWSADKERRNTVMQAALPKSVHQFFTPTLDPYTHKLLYGNTAPFKTPALPLEDLTTVLNTKAVSNQFTALIDEDRPPKGSNGWVVGSTKTVDGRAILANDMHLALRVPNIWYRTELHYQEVKLTGITLPGVPLMAAGSNGHVAWGFTNIEGDFVDLVTIELNADSPDQYRSSQGFVPFSERRETVRVKDGDDYIFTVQTTEWGPVLPTLLLDKPVAAHWIISDPSATNLDLLNMDKARDVQTAQKILNHAGGPPLNALLADDKGNIAWTYTGKIPKRFGFDGAVSQSWADGNRGWNGYIAPEQLPRRINPESGYIVNSNQRMLTEDYPYLIGHEFDQGARAYRISEQLAASERVTEQDMAQLQLDTKVDFYRYYQALALSLLNTDSDIKLKRRLSDWDGRAQRESLGFAVLVEFRRLLLKAVISPFLQACLEHDPTFRFSSTKADIPLQHLLNTKHPELLPDKSHFKDWDSFLRSILLQAQKNIEHDTQDFTWGHYNRVNIRHPFSASLPILQNWLDMPAKALPGCVQCVRVSGKQYGVSERMVVSPGNEKNALFQMPGGQSGHPFSPHYRDLQNGWIEGLSIPMVLTNIERHIVFRPE